MEKKKTFLKNNYWMAFPIIHIIASFFYEHAFFNFDFNLGTMNSIQLGESVSNSFEFILTYVISKIFAVVLIWMLWKLIFAIIEKKIPGKILIIFGCLFVLFTAICLIKWPMSMVGDGTSDHLITYLYAKSFVPYYWHSIFTGCLYAACLMVVPTAFSIPVFQSLMFFSVLGYVFSIIDRYTESKGKHKWAKYLILIMVFTPHFIDLISNSWRCCYYAILALLFFAMILETVLLEEKAGIKKLIIAMMIAALLSVWRSEGIFYGIFGFFALLIWGYRYKVKKVILWMAIFFVTFFLLGRPATIGQEKYYGNDYLIVCFINPLTNILNDTNNNLSYEGAEEDIAAIEAVVPISVLRQYGYLGYLSNNYAKGFEDIDQSGASKEAGSAFVKASIRMIVHNPKTYIKTQVNFWLTSFDVERKCYIEKFNGEKEEYLGFSREIWDKGSALLYSEPGVQAWIDNETRESLMYTVETIRGYYSVAWKGQGRFVPQFLGFLLLMVLDLSIVVTEIVNVFRKRRSNLIFGWIGMLLLVVMAATILTMPSAYVAYFYTFIYCSVMFIILYSTRY